MTIEYVTNWQDCPCCMTAGPCFGYDYSEWPFIMHMGTMSQSVLKDSDVDWVGVVPFLGDYCGWYRNLLDLGPPTHIQLLTFGISRNNPPLIGFGLGHWVGGWWQTHRDYFALPFATVQDVIDAGPDGIRGEYGEPPETREWVIA